MTMSIEWFLNMLVLMKFSHLSKGLAMHFVDSQDQSTETYPLNPNGSVGGVTGLCSTDGRVTIMMPHPEHTLRAYNHSWKPEAWDEDGAWMRMFRNARAWVR